MYEVLIFVALLVIFILILQIKSTQKDESVKLKNNLTILNNQLRELKDRIEFSKSTPIISIDEAEEKRRLEKIAAEEKAAAEYKQKIANLENLRIERERQKEEQLQTIVQTNAVENERVVEEATPQRNYTQEEFVEKESWGQRWIKNNPDIEKFIGENLFNKIGIAVLVFGIGFFVKYAIDQNWIGEYGRISIGLLCGVILVGLAHYLRNSYRSFSSVLAGGGIAVFYFTIAFAFHQYQIIGQTKAFIIMIIITGFAVALAILYDKLELAVIAAIGGFLTPFLVSNGSNNYVALFTYLIILNVGLLALAYYKKWTLINILALFFTIIIYGGWVIQTFVFNNDQPTSYANGILFGSIFYLIFLGMNMINNIKEKKEFKPFDFFILIFINATFFAAGMTILSQWHDGNYKGLFTILLAVINFGLAYYFYKTQKTDKNLLYLLIGLTLTFLSLAAPVQLAGHNITLFWSAEAVLLYWLYQRSQIKLFKTSSMLVLCLMFISLMLDWSFAGGENDYNNLPIIFTGIKGIITNIVAIAALVGYYLLLKKDETAYIKDIPNSSIGFGLLTVATIILYCTFYFGINLHYTNTQTYVFANVYHRILSNGFALILSLFILPRVINEKAVWVNIGLVFACFLFYVFSIGLISNLRIGVLAHEYKYVHMFAHWASIALLVVLVYNCIKTIRNNFEQIGSKITFVGWALSFVVVFMLSFELSHLYVFALSSFNKGDVLQSQYEKAGLTIVWSLCSFVMIWLGMKYKYKPLRIIAIVLFAIALLKLFLFDIRNISPGGKIAAFIMLGIILLSISFMYQRLKKILIDDEKK